MAYRTWIFDFDGTLADTLEETRKIFNKLAPEYGLREVLAEEMPHLRHMQLKDLLAFLGIRKSLVPILLARGTSLLRGNISQLPVIKGLAPVLPHLRHHVKSFGILTSNASANVDLFLRSHGLREHFDFISSTSKLTGKSKHLRAIQQTFSLDPAEMLYIGDEIRDIKASQKAGIAVAAVTWGFNSADALAAEKPDHVIDSPEQLKDLLHVL